MSFTLTLEDVERLGGTKEEFEELGDVYSGSEMEFGAEEEEEEDNLQRSEIEAYIRSIGLSTVSCGTNGERVGVGGAEDKAGEKASKQTLEKKIGKEVNKRAKKEKKDVGDTKRQQEPQMTAEPKNKKDKKNDKHKKMSKLTDGEGGPGSKECQMRPSVKKKEIEKQLLCISISPQTTKLVVSPDSQETWFEQSASTEAAFAVSETVLTHLNSLAQQLMNTETQLYEKFREKRKGASDVKWLKNVLSSGTLSDKVAAHTLQVQESPVHSLVSLDWLMGLVIKGGGVGKAMKGLHAKRKGILATNTLKELWVSELLPEHRKLKYLNQQPLDRLSTSSSTGSLTHQQSTLLLLWFFEDQIKCRYVQFINTLQAATHDPSEEVREKMVGHVFDLLHQRPEQEKLLLTQLVNKLGDPHRKVASKAVMFLLKLLNHHVNMKMVVTKEIESLLHRPNISPKAQYYSVCCLNQLVLSPEDGPLVAKLMDVYFTFFKVYVQKESLDSKMLAALLSGVNRAFPFMTEELPSFEVHLQSLFKVVHVGPVSTGIQALMLLHQVSESRHSVSDRYYNALYSKLMDPALKHSNRQAMFLNVLFKSLKSDPSMNRVKAFVKRMLYVCTCHSPSFVCGSLVLLSELLKEKPALWPFVMQSNDAEEFGDAPANHRGVERRDGEGEEGVSGAEEEKTEKTVGQSERYRIGHRNPQFSGAETTCLWELRELSRHYHPSVQLFSRKIAAGETVVYASDPLEDFTTIKFLDRFVYKNPKTRSSDHGGSAMQRISRSGMATNRELIANSAAFAALDESKVDAKDLFMHRFVTQRGKTTAVGRKRKRRKKSEDGEEGESGEDEQLEENNFADMDFAGELQREVREGQDRRKKKKRRGSDSSEDDDDGGSVGSSEDDKNTYRYEDMDEGVWGESEDNEGEGEKAETVSEAELEKLLLDNMSDNESGPEEADEREEDGKKTTGKKKLDRVGSSLKGKFDASRMFAAADEFSHLLESGADDGSHKKQLNWERKKSGRHEQYRAKGDGGRGRGRGRGGRREGNEKSGVKRGRGGGGGGREGVVKKRRLQTGRGIGRGRGAQNKWKNRIRT